MRSQMQGGKEHVLLVDDEPQILLALEDLLSDEYTVLKSTTPQHALEIVRQDTEIALVITDQRMPLMTGDEFLNRIDAQSHVQRIMVSGFADLPAVLRAFNDGKVFAYVTKPWDAEDLLRKVHSAVDHFRLTGELEHERSLLRDLMDNSPDGIYFKDAELRFLRANASFARSLGKGSPGELEGRRLSELVGGDPQSLLTEAEERLLLHELQPSLDVVRRSERSGRSYFISETKAPIRSVVGSAVGLVAISRDITQQRNLEQQLAQSQRLEAIGRLAGGVAHDFNNLLTVIVACGNLALEGLNDGELQRGNLDEILKAASHATLLVKQLLAFGQQQVIHPKELQLNDVIVGIESTLRRLLGNQHKLSMRLRPELSLVTADQSQVEQVMMNLMVNARDAMPDGGQLTIETGQDELGDSSAAELGVRSGKFVTLTVTDTGAGMTEETRQRLFEPFFTTKELGKGTGLGLATVYGIVRQNGGHIRVLSTLGEGTEFRILLPSSRSSAADPRASVPT